MSMTDEERNSCEWAKNAKAVRMGVYDVGILIGAILLADKIGELWPQYNSAAFVGASIMWVGTLFSRYSDWRAVDGLEKGLNRDELERERDKPFTKEELKNLGLD